MYLIENICIIYIIYTWLVVSWVLITSTYITIIKQNVSFISCVYIVYNKN